MRRGDIDRFFLEVSREIVVPVRVYLTGGIASWFMGGDRPTEDIDFGLSVAKGHWDQVEKSFQGVSQRLNIPIQFSDDIGRWGMVGVSGYEKGSRLYKKFAKISVYLLDPAIWSVGKINRYYRSDVEDLRAVLKKQKTTPIKLIQAWAKALRESPRSSAQLLFVKTGEDFLKNYGNEIWGEGFDSAKSIAYFRKLAGLLS